MQEYPKDYKISRLIAKKVMGTLSPGEEGRLCAWLAEDVRNEALYARILEGQNKCDRERYLETLNVDRSWKSVKRHMTRETGGHVRFARRAFAAASVVLMLAVGLYLFRPADRPAIVPNPAGVVVVGSSRAVLVTGRGESIELDDTSVREIRAGGRIVAVSDGEKVSYQPESGVGEPGEIEYNTIRVPRGGEYKLLLSDQSAVYLNADSEIRFPVKFGGGKREVFLSGEAFFEVAGDSTRPFIVRAGEAVAVEVLGTRFNVQAYRDEDVVETTLNAGSVRVYDKARSVKLRPNQQAVYSKRNGALTTRDVDADRYSAWKDGRLVLKENSLEEIMFRLGRWYNIAVFWVDAGVKEYHFSGELARYDDFGEVLRMLEKATRVRFEVKDRTVFVYKNDK